MKMKENFMYKHHEIHKITREPKVQENAIKCTVKLVLNENEELCMQTSE